MIIYCGSFSCMSAWKNMNSPPSACFRLRTTKKSASSSFQLCFAYIQKLYREHQSQGARDPIKLTRMGKKARRRLRLSCVEVLRCHHPHEGRPESQYVDWGLIYLKLDSMASHFSTIVEPELETCTRNIHMR